MKFFLALGLTLGMLLVIILLSRLHIEVKAKRKGSDDYIKIIIKMWFGLIRVQREFPLLNISKDLTAVEYRAETEAGDKPIAENKSSFTLNDLGKIKREMNQFLQRVHELNKIMKRLMRRVYVKKLTWRTGIGSGDAAETGTITGLVWGIKASVIGMVSTYVTMHTIPKMYVQPFFNEKKIETEFEGIFRLRIGYAMLAGIRILLNLRKRRDSSWQNTLFKA